MSKAEMRGSRGNNFGPEAVGAAARGCNPAAIPALDAARPAFARWAGPRE